MTTTMQSAESFIDLSMQSAAAPLRPVSPGERIPALDVMRGFAIFGVLLAYALWNLGSPPESTYGNTDRILNGVLSALIDTKCYTLLAFLFGLGFSIQLRRAEARGLNFVPVYCRKLVALLLIGLTHALLLRNGDILVPYAAMGFVLLLFHNASNKTIAIGAFVGLIYPYLVRNVWNLAGLPFPQRPEAAGASYLVENIAWVRYWYAAAIASWPASLPMFLFGLYAGKRRFFENITAHQKELWRVLVIGLSLGVLAYAGRELLFATKVKAGLVLGLLWSAHAWGLAAFYASSILLLLQRRSWQVWCAPLGAVGRMALTNYLLQAAIIVPVCLIFKLFDQVTPTLGFLLALAVWAIQVPASVWWLKQFRFGPVEWLWRSLTYGYPQPMRVAHTPVIA